LSQALPNSNDNPVEYVYTHKTTPAELWVWHFIWRYLRKTFTPKSAETWMVILVSDDSKW
jgi:hypothetical protein